MTRHTTPIQCLRALPQEISDGGRAEYLAQESGMGYEQEIPKGDCAIVATVYATFHRPAGQAYRDARFHLASGMHRRVFERRERGEPTMGFVLRRIKQHFRPPGREPMHGTPNQATLSYLLLFGYEHIYPNTERRWHCVCDPRCTFLVDMVMPGGGHAICVRGGTAYSTIPCDPDETEVVNVLRLGPDKTAYFRALERYQEDHETWLHKMIENLDRKWDWSGEPKLDDYLKSG